MRYLPIIVAIAILVTSTATNAQGKAEAKQRFNKGVKLFKKGNYEGALVEFEAAYEAQPHFKVRYNIGMTLYHLDRYVEAEEELKAYINEGGDAVPKGKKTEVQSILYEIASYIGSVTFDCDIDGAQVFVDGEYVATLPISQPMKLDVGEHIIEVKAEGFSEYSEKVSVPGGKDILVEAELDDLDQSSEGSTGLATASMTAPPSGKECTFDGHCRWPAVCFREDCVSKVARRSAKRGGLDLIISGTVLVAVSVAGIAVSAELINMGWWQGGVPILITSLSVFCTGLPLFIAGLVIRKKYPRDPPRSGVIYSFSGDGYEVVLVPSITPIPGGGMLGVGGYF